ncbi:hypothetical protein [Rummeliibacillus pycnus]|uniref:hypothetical protein n=1 Tax=Rummeliibacillus pycnus TaxID=101070 RepID=UPI003D28F0AF
MGFPINNDLQFIRYFLPPTASILELPQKGPVIQHVDVDGDSIEELVIAYTYRGDTFLLMLKQINFQWQPIVHMKIDEHTLAELHSVKLNHSSQKALVIEWKMKYLPSYLDYLVWTPNGFERVPVDSPQIVIAKSYGDVTGDGTIDTVYLTGTKQADSPYWQNIHLVIFQPSKNTYEKIPLKENEDSGYNPTIFLGDFTGNHVQDILITIDTGGSGGTIYAYIYSYINGRTHLIFDGETYQQQSHYTVNYEDFYKVGVISSSPKKRYILDIRYKGKEYLSEIYNPDGTLKAPITGWVDPLGGLYPIDFDRNGTYELLAFQKIAGRYHADGLGYVQNVLFWDGKQFVTERQNVSIEGGDF